MPLKYFVLVSLLAGLGEVRDFRLYAESQAEVETMQRKLPFNTTKEIKTALEGKTKAEVKQFMGGPPNSTFGDAWVYGDIEAFDPDAELTYTGVVIHWSIADDNKCSGCTWHQPKEKR